MPRTMKPSAFPNRRVSTAQLSRSDQWRCVITSGELRRLIRGEARLASTSYIDVAFTATPGSGLAAKSSDRIAVEWVRQCPARI